MKLRFSLPLAALLLAGPCFGQDALTLKGDGVKVVTVVEKFPLTITAPANGLMRQWDVPAGVTFVNNGASIEVKEAGPGETTIGVRYVVIDWEAKKADEKLLRITFTVGGVGPTPEPVDPEAVPSAALKKAMQEAYAAETDPMKADHTATLAKLLGSVVSGLRQSGKVTTNTQFQTTVHDATNIAIGAGALPVLRPAIGAFVQTRLPRTPGQPTDEAFWRSASIAYSQVSQALKGVK